MNDRKYFKDVPYSLPLWRFAISAVCFVSGGSYCNVKKLGDMVLSTCQLIVMRGGPEDRLCVLIYP